MNRDIYFTPKNFIDFINLFKKELKQQSDEL